MKEIPTIVRAAAAASIGSGGRVLMQRPHGAHHGAVWDSSAAKRKKGETPRFALCRKTIEEFEIGLAEGALDCVGWPRAKSNGRPALVLFLYN